MEAKFEILRLQTVEEMLGSFELIKQLTPTLNINTYRQYLGDMVPHNYFQIIIRLNQQTLGVSGCWIATKLYCGRYLEIDNFVVDKNHRSIGIGEKMMNYLDRIARENHCDVMMLDAYRENIRAHAFYERCSFRAKGFHFIKKVN